MCRKLIHRPRLSTTTAKNMPKAKKFNKNWHSQLRIGGFVQYCWLCLFVFAHNIYVAYICFTENCTTHTRHNRKEARGSHEPKRTHEIRGVYENKKLLFFDYMTVNLIISKLKTKNLVLRSGYFLIYLQNSEYTIWESETTDPQSSRFCEITLRIYDINHTLFIYIYIAIHIENAGARGRTDLKVFFLVGLCQTSVHKRVPTMTEKLQSLPIPDWLYYE